MPTVLVVDDEPAIRESLERALALEGYAVVLAADGEAALARLAESAVDATVLDIAMPGIDGIEVCGRMRDAGDRSPVLMLTARDAVADRVDGLDAGADDYLVAVRARRAEGATAGAAAARRPGRGSPTRFADLSLDRSTREVHRGGRELDLTRTEFSLLELFLAHPRQVLSRSQIYESVWGYDFGEARTRSGSTSATCGARRRRRASRA